MKDFCIRTLSMLIWRGLPNFEPLNLKNILQNRHDINLTNAICKTLESKPQLKPLSSKFLQECLLLYCQPVNSADSFIHNLEKDFYHNIITEFQESCKKNPNCKKNSNSCLRYPD